MKPSLLRNILLAFLGFGLLMGIIFPFYAAFFVEYKDGLYLWFVIGCLVAGALIGVINYYLLNKLLIQKLKRIAAVSTAISNNDLSFFCELKSDDVIGDIVVSFNKMAETLRSVIGEIQNNSQQMLSGATRICEVANETKNGVQQQHSETENFEQAILDMARIAQQVSDKVLDVTQAASLAKAEAGKGTLVVAQTLDSIRSLANEVEDASNSINQLEDESNNIGGVLDVIRSISDQTNLLALNAAIEAARAGDQGRGFAVVADEVRTLAQRTQDSTKEIQTMIDNLQSVSQVTVAAMQEGKTKANSSVEQATQARDSLQEIATSVEAITAMNTQISEEADSQTQVASAVRKNISTIIQIANKSKIGSENTVLESDKVAGFAASLQEIVGRFKL